MSCSDGNFWVVKFQNNPQHLRVLVNEMIATRLAETIGLTVPATAVVEVEPWLVANTRGMVFELGQGNRQRYASGLQFGSLYVVGRTMDYLPDQQLSEVSNLAEFAGILCFDKWTCNKDGRQAVFARGARERTYRATFIDQGHCFHAGDWTFPDAPLRGMYANSRVYAKVTGWDSFEPWLSRIEAVEPSVLAEIAASVPPEWYGRDKAAIERLMEHLLRRRSRVRELIEACGCSDRAPFPNWVRKTPCVK